MRKALAILVALLVISLILAGCMVETPPLILTPSEEEPSTTELAPAVTEEKGTPQEKKDAPEPAATDVTTKDELKVHFIDVGQGDSILIDLGKTEILIDGGGKSPGVVEYLSDYVDGAIEAMVATHPHADHIGGLIKVLDVFQVEQIWLNGDTSTSQTYSQFMLAVNSEGAQVYEARRGDTIQVDDLILNVLHPDNLSGTTNNNSIVLSLSFGSAQLVFLFMGDAEKEAEASMLVAGLVPDVEVLKVGHHGSSSSSTVGFLDITKPVYAIYMAGEGNSYGHPHQETITNLGEVLSLTYGTDEYGTIIVTTDGSTLVRLIISPPEETSPPPPTPITEGEEPALQPTPVPTDSDVQITRIFYDGLVPYSESDEYVEIKNLGDEPQDLAGWVLKDISEGYPSLTFPSYILGPGERIRVYTNEIHPESGGFSFNFGKAAWNNKSPETAALFNDQGQEVSRKSY